MALGNFARCDHVVELTGDYLERALDARTLAELEQHLLICGDCERYVQQLRAVTEAARAAALAEEAGTSAEPAPEAVLALFRKLRGDAP